MANERTEEERNRTRNNEDGEVYPTPVEDLNNGIQQEYIEIKTPEELDEHLQS